MKTLKTEDINKVYEELGLLGEDNVEVNSELNEGNIINELNYNFMSSHDGENLSKLYYKL